MDDSNVTLFMNHLFCFSVKIKHHKYILFLKMQKFVPHPDIRSDLDHNLQHSSNLDLFKRSLMTKRLVNRSIFLVFQEVQMCIYLNSILVGVTKQIHLMYLPITVTK